MALALYRKYRPRTFAEVIGQEHVTEPLSQALRSGRLNHAYLFSGPRGCGKTSSARILARSLNCEQGPTPEPCGVCGSCRSLANDGGGSIDVIEIDAASHGGVDDARELREKAFFAPANSRFKIYVIDEAHMVSSAGFNALLKLVEEPPEYVKFIFATTEPEKVLGTIRSRTHHYPFRLIPPATLRPYLQQLTEAEGVHVDPAVFPLVVRAGGGSARDSLSVLDQLIAGAGPDGVSYPRAVALLGVTDAALLDEMCDALAAGDGAAAYQTIDRVAEAGHDPRRFASDLLERLRDLIVLQQIPDAVTKGLIDGPADQLEQMAAQATRLGPATLSRCADIVHNGLVEMRGTTAPRLLLELITARMLLPGAEDSTGSLLQRLERMERRLTLTGDTDPLPVRAEHPSTPPQEASSAPPPAGPGGGGLSAARAAAAAAAAAAGRRTSPKPAAAASPAAPVSAAPVSAAPASAASVAAASGSTAPSSMAPGSMAPGSAVPGSAGPAPAAASSGAASSGAASSGAAVFAAPGSAEPVSPAPDSGASMSVGPGSAVPVSAAPAPAAAGAGLSRAELARPTPEDESPPWDMDEPPMSEPPSPTPVSAAPFSAAPVSAAPVSARPVSAAPVSAAPISSAPVSSAPPVREPAGIMPDAPEDFGGVADTGAPGQLTAASIREVWPEIMVAVGRKSKKISALAQGATVRELEGQTLVLTFRFPAHARMVSAEPQLIADALYEALGVRWQIRCDVGGDGGGGGGSAPRRPQGPPPRGDGGGREPERAATTARPQSAPAEVPNAAARGPVAQAPAAQSPVAQAAAPQPSLAQTAVAQVAAVPVAAVPVAAGSVAQSDRVADGVAPRSAAARPAVDDDDDGGWPEPVRPGGLASVVRAPSVPAEPEPEDDGGWPEPVRPGGQAPQVRADSPPAVVQAVPEAAPTGRVFTRNATPAAAAPPATAVTSQAASAPAKTQNESRTRPEEAPSSAIAAARAAAARGAGAVASRAAAGGGAGSSNNRAGNNGGGSSANGGGAWSDGSPTEEAPYDPEYDGPPGAVDAASLEGFDPGDEPSDEVIDEKTARQSSEQQAMQLLRDVFGAEKISES
ncbi:DNA polymerase III subunit gamma and tau [Actinoplanes sp. NPDC051494]|uniref:DNA polymerase III subunit gamma and tau n=1 Tax=Actinoplanes sp. NPDC051494 TaxID=3363907 RepID=UPI0037909C6B